MPKRYEFHSKLPPEEIFVRLRAYAKPAKWADGGDRSFIYMRHKKGFSLAYTGEWPVRGVLPFWAEVKNEEGGSVISGGLPIWRNAWVITAQFFGFTLLMTPIFQIPLRMYPMIVAVLLLNVPIAAGFESLTHAICFKKRQKAVLEFIQQHLLE